MTEAQALFVQLEATVNNLSLERPWSPEPQALTRAKTQSNSPHWQKRERHQANPNQQETMEKATPGLLSPPQEKKTHSAEAQKPEGML